MGGDGMIEGFPEDVLGMLRGMVPDGHRANRCFRRGIFVPLDH